MDDSSMKSEGNKGRVTTTARLLIEQILKEEEASRKAPYLETTREGATLENLLDSVKNDRPGITEESSNPSHSISGDGRKWMLGDAHVADPLGPVAKAKHPSQLVESTSPLRDPSLRSKANPRKPDNPPGGPSSLALIAGSDTSAPGAFAVSGLRSEDEDLEEASCGGVDGAMRNVGDCELPDLDCSDTARDDTNNESLVSVTASLVDEEAELLRLEKKLEHRLAGRERDAHAAAKDDVVLPIAIVQDSTLKEASSPSCWHDRKVVIIVVLLLCVAAVTSALLIRRNDDDDVDDRCFADSLELRDEVNLYLWENANETAQARQYGWPIGTWCVSKVEDFSLLFSPDRISLAETFDEDISQWDTSNARNMSQMFQGNLRFNRNISGWDVSRVITMENMFQGAGQFNHDLSGWDVSSIRDLRGWNGNNADFSQNLCSWVDTLPADARVEGMFHNTSCPVQGDPVLDQESPGPMCFPCDDGAR